MAMKEGWEIKKIAECFSYIKNGANIKQSSDAEGFPITRIETLSNGVFNRDRLGFANIFDIGKYTDFVLNEGDILMSHINSAKFLGRSVLYKKLEGETIIHGMNLLRLISIKEIINPAYAVYFFKSFYFKSQIASITKKAVNQASFTTTALKNLKIIVPPITEQTRIVEELDLLNGILDKKRQQLKELDTLSQSIFYDMFGEPIDNEKGWDIKKLGEVCNLKAGKSIKASELTSKKTDINYPCYGGNGIRGYIEKLSHKGNYPIIGRQGALCGNVVYATGEFYATEHAVVVDCLTNDINSLWLYYTLSIMNLNRYAQGVAQPGLAVSTINKVNIPVPPLTLQTEFANKIKSIEHQKELIKQSIAETQTLLDSRMDYYFN